ncbi:MAG: S-adenosylmethionine:tRNA ribosyltransferase-isomerase [Muribaculum sp.]|nr:S-adenosylmethionine:tRNA ribosyltransferase-isomerase [Muribaculum sp.]
MLVKDIRIEDFDYHLPDECIARFPLARRDACKLIMSDAEGNISHHIFSDLPSLIARDSLMICNETKVINARMEFHKSTGARIEVFLLEPFAPSDYVLSFARRSSCRWTCLVGNRKKWKGGKISKLLHIPGIDSPVNVYAEIAKDAPGTSAVVEFSWHNPECTFASIVETAGNIPIPPYLKRESMDSDTRDYQTVFSRVQGSVAAPTAGLHFTDRLLDEMRGRGVEMQPLTLHVGAGTFQPVKSATIGEHPMHTETFTVSRSLVNALISALATGRNILAVGTTSVRTLESLPYLGMLLSQGEDHPHITQWMAYDEACAKIKTEDALKAVLARMDADGSDSFTASTAIMIAPGFNWRIVSGMVTNFHQPQSTLLLLVSSFLNPDGNDNNPQWQRLYAEALEHDYRFLSYGDACLLKRGCRQR